MATKRQRYMISVDDELKQQIEDYRFSQRFNTMSDATQELIKLGLKAFARLQDADRPFRMPVNWESMQVAETGVEYNKDKEGEEDGSKR